MSQLLIPNVHSLSSGIESSAPQNLRSTWLDYMQRDPHSNIYQHPDIVALHEGTASPAVHVADETLAILIPKPYPVRPLPPLRWTLKLPGYKLAGNHVLNASTEQSVAAFALAMKELVTKGPVGCVLLEHVEVGSALWNVLTATSPHSGMAVIQPAAPQPHWWIRFPEQPADYWKKFSGETRGKFRSRNRKFTHRLVRYSTVDQVPGFLAQAHDISKTSWQSKRLGLRLHNSKQELEFWTVAASLGAMRCYILEHEEKPVAFGVGLQWKGRFLAEETGYDPAWSNSSPGAILLHCMLDDMIAFDPPTLLDFGLGDAEYKRMLGNHQTSSGPLLLLASRGRAMLSVKCQRAGQGLFDTLRNMLTRTPFYRRMRRFYHH